jgi:hypothetical protein
LLVFSNSFSKSHQISIFRFEAKHRGVNENLMPQIFRTVPPIFFADQARTGRGIHGLPKVSCGPAMPNPYTLIGWQPTAVFFPLGYPFPYGPVADAHVWTRPQPSLPLSVDTLYLQVYFCLHKEIWSGPSRILLVNFSYYLT